MRPPTRWPLLALGALVASFVALGWRGLDFGYHWDERPCQVNPVRYSLHHGTPLPNFYVYPSLNHALNLLALAPEAAGALVRGAPWLETLDAVVLSPAYLLRLRGLRVALVSLALVWVFLAARQAGAGRATAWLAPAVLGLSWEVGYHSRWAAPDALMMQFAALWLWLVLRVPRSLPAAAAAAALACGTKYPGGILLAPVLALALFAAGRPWRARLGEALRAGLVFAAVFLVTTPGSLLQTSAFVSQVRRSMSWYATGHMGHTIAPGLPHLAAIADYASFALLSPWPGAAGLWTALALGGLAVTLRRDPTRGLLLTAVPLAYAVYFAQQRVMIVRNLLLLAPFLAVGVAQGAAALGRVVARRPVRGLLAGAAASLLLAQAVDLGARAESIRRRGDRAAFERALQAFVRRQQAKPLGASPRAAALLPGLPTSGPRAAAAELWVTYAREPPPAEWPANRRGLVVAVFGPEEVNYDYYPTWEGDDRLLVLSGPRARSEGLAPDDAGSR